ncbi:alpha-1-3-glucan synthase [Penicillium capsulatum]|uniref:alpha-1,3-glucan synthase n=1 Tax=Penicillium capsulatum TaxID=69766 RepID=A0A9W9ILD8_9EURO|nr:alpha-1-3-glucan synthase [Penicillium capsulatum]KAJ6122229.1 alpha-1-3-glucan synthase [Penicillium capsulatum]
MRLSFSILSTALFATIVKSWPYDEALLDYNLNENKTATNAADYWGEWPGHKGKYHASPKNWRFPFYTLFLDRFVNGDPSNDNINGTLFEHDLNSNQMRHGGDVAGLVDTLDYLQGLGIKGLYLAGTSLMNQPWGFDGYSALDTTLLDQHYGTIQVWRNAISEIHKRGMYVVFDNTIATMGDLIGFEGHLNTTTPFSEKEYPAEWKSARRYMDFNIGDSYNTTCDYPRFWFEDGYPVNESLTSELVGCYDSDFDQYGDIEAFGVFPDWQRQLAKFASVQDRLREWQPTVRDKLIRHSCMIISSLDIDGFRYDKATQATVEALGDMSSAYRECARAVGKDNFFIAGEITGGNTFGSIYLGRGRQPNQYPKDAVQAMKMTNESSSQYFLREIGHEAIDGAAFHYSTYRALTRFLGMDGQLSAGYDVPINWVDAWNEMLQSNDLINANTGKFDPRHMFGVTNQDVFRWPAIKNGVERQLLGSFVTTLLIPGIPLLLWGEEQAFYVLDATASNYIYGRQSMSPATAWRTHGCFSLESSQYYEWPVESGKMGCHDESVAYDHRDPTHPVHNIMKHMYQLRLQFPVLNDGYSIQNLSNITQDVFYPGSNDTATETGMWSIVRQINAEVQDLGSDYDNQPVWLVYQNVNRTMDYDFDCTDKKKALIAPFDAGTWVKNLFYPHDEFQLKASPVKIGLNGSTEHNGCYPNMTMDAYEFRAYVPKSQFVRPRPMLSKFTPGHDIPLRSTVAPNLSEDVDIELYFTEEMDCQSVTSNLYFNSSTEIGKAPLLKKDTIKCGNITATKTSYTGEIPSVFKWAASLTGVYNGVHRLTLNNASNYDGTASTGAVDHLLFRIGQIDNPMVFSSANYSTSLLHREDHNSTLFIQHHAAGADKYRYSTNWGSTFSDWKSYTGGNDTIDTLDWSGTKKQAWKGEHVRVEYWSRWTGSSDYVQEGDADWKSDVPRRYPHAFFNGPFNQYGYDAGLDNLIELDTEDGYWKYHFTSEWPAVGQLNIWGINPDGKPDQSWVLGDADGDNVLDRMPPSSLTSTLLNITKPPPSPYLAWKLYVNDATQRYDLIPVGQQSWQIIMFVLFWIIPPMTAATCVYVFMKSFYKVKFNQNGTSEKTGFAPMVMLRKLKLSGSTEKGEHLNPLMRLANKSGFMQSTTALGGAAGEGGKRRMVLIATMEYDIEDWAIKIKIGGLGVMAQLMGKTLGHQDLIWVVPCVGGIDYPVDQEAEPMTVVILGSEYQVKVQYHVLKNITYVLLDAPVFRQQSKSEPYPARMDDLDSAIYYSAWNQCIAQAIQRFPIDLYHINDYHGSVAPLYLLPQTTIPVCLSLHNAEFQGLWPMRTQKERREVSSVFNLDEDVARRYVQFGEVFNLLHAGASYLRVQQQGFGAVGVSRKYGKRSYARYPIFWGLRKVGNLPNPDPSDVGEWTKQSVSVKEETIAVDPAYEASRGELKRQAQEWAGLDQNPDADLLVFVGRWSMQKGVDLIADAMPAVLEARPNVQVICIGPVIDLYGKFAALKLGRMMEVYPGRVFSKPEFTALPPFIFSGAEFALIPSRDEPFGLVAVEFGRKGALGIGARVGGLGQMPGWWYNVESTSTSHLLVQFKLAIEAALNSKTETRAIMRARSAKQRFPVAQWVEDLEILQSTAIEVHNKVAKGHGRPATASGTATPIGATQPQFDMTMSPLPSPGIHNAFNHSRDSSYSSFNQASDLGSPKHTVYSRDLSPSETEKPKSGLSRSLSLGVRSGPGHRSRRGRRGLAEDGVEEVDTENEHSDSSPHADDSNDDERAHSIYGDDEYTLTPDEVERERRAQAARQNGSGMYSPARRMSQDSIQARSRVAPLSPMTPGTPPAADQLLLPPRPFAETNRYSSTSVLSLDSVVGNKKDFKLQKVDPFFTDGTGEYFHNFEQKLQNLNGANSEADLCIEEFLIKSEQEWFDRFRNAKLGRHNPKSPTPSIFRSRHNASPAGESYNDEALSHIALSEDNDSDDDEFLLGKDYVPPTGLRKWMQIKIGDWPVYSIVLALGQIIAANSYQITLLTGEVGESAEKLYGIATTYAITSVCWWLMFRYFKSVVCLSVPWFFYGLAFLLIGSAHWEVNSFNRGWIQNVGSGCYAAASSSGSIFFASNFGDEGGAPVETWIFRACVIQGIQQAYVIALWYWGSTLTKASSEGLLNSDTTISNTWKMTAICYPIAIFVWGIGLLLVLGLPNYYRQKPGKVSSFYKSLVRRKVVLWNFVAVILQNFFLSAPYGRNWSFLWSSAHAHAWEIVILCVVFFGVVWCVFLFIISKFSKKHSWFLPVFACGLGAPRFIQIWWGVSGIGYHLPWVAGGYTGAALASRSLWLWLGVLDSIQGLGFGVILLQTLTRVHMCFALIASQVIGSIATICARAFGPNNVGPGPISPDMTKGSHELANAWFWVALFCQLLICAGFLLFFRKEQLSKP